MVCCATVCQKRNFCSKIKVSKIVNFDFFDKIGQKFAVSTFNFSVKIEIFGMKIEICEKILGFKILKSFVKIRFLNKN